MVFLHVTMIAFTSISNISAFIMNLTLSLSHSISHRCLLSFPLCDNNCKTLLFCLFLASSVVPFAHHWFILYNFDILPRLHLWKVLSARSILRFRDFLFLVFVISREAQGLLSTTHCHWFNEERLRGGVSECFPSVLGRVFLELFSHRPLSLILQHYLSISCLHIRPPNSIFLSPCLGNIPLSFCLQFWYFSTCLMCVCMCECVSAF